MITADFSQIAVGQSVEGPDVVAPNLNIDANGTAVRILPDMQPAIYIAPNSGAVITNGGLAPGGGFTDMVAKDAGQAHLYTFTFAPRISTSEFSLHMLDYGDYNPTASTTHYVSMTAYDENGAVVDIQELSYTTLAETFPGSSNLYGDLQLSGDATGALAGQPGNWTWHVSGTGIVKVVLEFGAGFDPRIGFDTLSFTTECPQ